MPSWVCPHWHFNQSGSNDTYSSWSVENRTYINLTNPTNRTASVD